MAKGGKFTKLMKKLSLRKTTQTNTSSWDSTGDSSSMRSDDVSLSSSIDDNSSRLHTVHVGKSRRQYFVNSDVVAHSIIRQLAGESAGAGEMTVGCEVVLFDHLLWMLENGDHETDQLSSLDELVGYYAC